MHIMLIDGKVTFAKYLVKGMLNVSRPSLSTEENTEPTLVYTELPVFTDSEKVNLVAKLTYVTVDTLVVPQDTISKVTGKVFATKDEADAFIAGTLPKTPIELLQEENTQLKVQLAEQNQTQSDFMDYIFSVIPTLPQ